MAGIEWREIASLTKEDETEGRSILAWHTYQGHLVYDSRDAAQNSYITHYQDLPTAWTDAREALPAHRGIRENEILLVINRYGEARLKRCLQITGAEEARKWTTLPAPPVTRDATEQERTS